MARREVRERWWAVVGAAALAVAAVLGAGNHFHHRKQFTSTATLIVSPGSSSATLGGKTSAVSTLEIGQSLVSNSAVVTAATANATTSVERAVKKAGQPLDAHDDFVPPTSVSASLTVQNQTLTITVVGVRAASATYYASSLGTEITSYLLSKDRAAYNTQLVLADKQASSLNSEVSILTQKLQAALRSAPPGVDPAKIDLALREKLATTNAQFKAAQQRVTSLTSDGPPGLPFLPLGQTGAVASGSSLIPSSRTSRAALGALLGVLLGLIALAVLARADTRIRSREAAEAAFGTLVLAEVPHVGRQSTRMSEGAWLKSPASMAYQSLGVSLVELEGDRQQNSMIAIASANSREGRSTVAANLAASTTLLERRVLVVDADSSRPGVSDVLGVPRPDRKAGASSGVNETIQDSNVRGVAVLELAGSGLPIVPRARRLTDRLKSEADTVIVDTAPLLEAPESLPLVGLTDIVVIVCRWGRTSRAAAWQVAEQLTRVNTRVAGVVLVDGPRSTRRARPRNLTAPPSAREAPHTAAPDTFGLGVGDARNGNNGVNARVESTQSARAGATQVDDGTAD
jgi:Mrp family chromosome partitioning ATPase